MNRLSLFRFILDQSNGLKHFRPLSISLNPPKKLPTPGDPVYDEDLVDFGRKDDIPKVRTCSKISYVNLNI